MVKLNTCCGCATLRTGSLIIGWLGIVGFILYGVKLPVSFSGAEEAIDQNQITCDGRICTDEEKIEMKTVLKITVIITLIACAIGLLVNILLVIGVVKRTSQLICVWLVVSIIGMAGSVFVFVRALVNGFGGQGDQFIVAVSSVVEIIVTIYCVVVVYSFKQEIVSNPEQTVEYTA